MMHGRLKPAGALWLLIAVCGFGWCPSGGRAACRIGPIDGDKGKGWVLENEVIAVRLRPQRQGAIDDFRLKSNGLMTVKPYVESREELIPGTGIYGLATKPSGGFHDAIWKGGLDEFAAGYDFKVLENTPQRITVQMTLATAAWKIERELTLLDGRSDLACRVRLSAKGDKPVPNKSYWCQWILRLGDTLLSMPGDDSEVLLVPVRREAVSVRGLAVPFDAARVVPCLPGDGNGPRWFAPGQPWMAGFDRTAKLIFGAWFDVPGFPADMVYYSWLGGGTEYSMEAIFPETTFVPGKPREFNFRMMALCGLPAVHLLRPGFALYLDKPAAGKAKRRCAGEL